MKLLPLIAVASALVAVPAAADIVHQTSLDHDGQPVAVRYEPRTRTTLRQSGLGPRNMERCLWKTEVSVERRIARADGRAVEALTRTVDAAHASEGVQAGYCSQMREGQTAPFGGDHDKLRAFLADAAERDARGLRTELASLGSLARGASR